MARQKAEKGNREGKKGRRGEEGREGYLVLFLRFFFAGEVGWKRGDKGRESGSQEGSKTGGRRQGRKHLCSLRWHRPPGPTHTPAYQTISAAPFIDIPTPQKQRSEPSLESLNLSLAQHRPAKLPDQRGMRKPIFVGLEH